MLTKDDTDVLPVVEHTTDYGKFVFLEENRDVDPRKVSTFKVSTLESPHLPPLNPILVNEKYEIFDGQHRFLAWKELNLPVFFFKSSLLKSQDIITLNKDRKNWTVEEYIDFHVAKGNRNFIALREFSEKTKFSINISCLFLGMTRVSLLKNIREGSLQMPPENKIEEAATRAMSLKKFQKKIYDIDRNVYRIVSSYSFCESIAVLSFRVNT